MSDFLDNLVARTLDPSASFQPRQASLFEPLSSCASPASPAGEETVTTEIPYAILHAPAAGKTSAPPEKATIPAQETPVESGGYQPPSVIRNSGPEETIGATPLTGAATMRGPAEAKSSAEPVSPAPSEVALSPPPQTPAADPGQGEAQPTAAPAHPSRPPTPMQWEAVDSTAPAPRQPPGKTAPPPSESGNEAERDPPRAATLSTMVRQWVLQPAVCEVVLKPEVPPAETPPSAATAPPRIKPQESPGEGVTRPSTEIPAHRRKVDSIPPHPTPGFNRAKPAPERERDELPAERERHALPRESPPASSPLKPLAVQPPPFPGPSQQTTEVHISIGRVEVRAYPERSDPAPAPRRRPQPEVMSLEAYLAQRTSGKE